MPDNVLTPLIKSVTSDNYFIAVNATREDEAMGMVAGAAQTARDPVLIRQRFMKGLGTSRGAALD